MNSLKMNRFIAYFIDLLIISILALMVSKISVLNPYENKYQKTFDDFTKYTENINKNVDNVKSVSDIITPQYQKYLYSLEKYGLSYTVSEILIVVLYFTLFPFFNGGCTVGQRMMRLKVVNHNNEKPSLAIFFIRSLFIPLVTTIVLYNVILNIITIPLLFMLGYKAFFKVNMTLTLIICVYCYIDAIMMLKNPDATSLHDKMTKTKVVSFNPER